LIDATFPEEAVALSHHQIHEQSDDSDIQHSSNEEEGSKKQRPHV